MRERCFVGFLVVCVLSALWESYYQVVAFVAAVVVIAAVRVFSFGDRWRTRQRRKDDVVVCLPRRRERAKFNSSTASSSFV